MALVARRSRQRREKPTSKWTPSIDHAKEARLSVQETVLYFSRLQRVTQNSPQLFLTAEIKKSEISQKWKVRLAVLFFWRESRLIHSRAFPPHLHKFHGRTEHEYDSHLALNKKHHAVDLFVPFFKDLKTAGRVRGDSLF